jgi:hypothetical protein
MFDSLFKWEARQSFYKSLGNIKCDKFFNRWNRKKSDKKLIGSSVAGGEYQLQAYIYSKTTQKDVVLNGKDTLFTVRPVVDFLCCR